MGRSPPGGAKAFDFCKAAVAFQHGCSFLGSLVNIDVFGVGHAVGVCVVSGFRIGALRHTCPDVLASRAICRQAGATFLHSSERLACSPSLAQWAIIKDPESHHAVLMSVHDEAEEPRSCGHTNTTTTLHPRNSFPGVRNVSAAVCTCRFWEA